MHDTSSGQYILNTLVAGKDTVPMVFDTGNSRTGLSPNYYTLHREEIDRSGKSGKRPQEVSAEFARYGLRPEEYNLHDRRRLPHPEKVTVTADFGPASEQPYFGSLGMDLFESSTASSSTSAGCSLRRNKSGGFRPAPCTTELPVPS